jgi:hypothetical protein
MRKKRIGELTKETDGIPPSTAYKWVHKKQNLEVFIRLGRSIYVDCDALEQLFERNRMAPLLSHKRLQR